MLAIGGFGRMTTVLEGSREEVRESSQDGRSLATDEAGVAYVEYIVLVLLVGILVAAAIMALGIPLLEHFRMTQSLLGAPIP